MTGHSSPGGSKDDIGVPPSGGAIEGPPRWVKTFGVVTLLLLVGFVVLHVTGHQLGGHMPSDAHQQHPSGSGSP